MLDMALTQCTIRMLCHSKYSHNISAASQAEELRKSNKETEKGNHAGASMEEAAISHLTG